MFYEVTRLKGGEVYQRVVLLFWSTGPVRVIRTRLFWLNGPRSEQGLITLVPEGEVRHLMFMRDEMMIPGQKVDGPLDTHEVLSLIEKADEEHKGSARALRNLLPSLGLRPR